jgi:electron transfer flavoprotein beta subunit
MHIYVCTRQVPSTETKIKLRPDSSGIESSDIKWVLSPYDEFALEEAIALKEKNPGSSVSVVSVGPPRVVESLRTGLAMGADRGIFIEAPDTIDSHLIAKALAQAIKKQTEVRFIFTGKEAIDEGSAQVGPLLATFLGIPYVTVVQSIQYQPQLVCKREIEAGAFELVEISPPLLISCQKGLNTPRYASVPNIVKAKTKPIEMLKLADLGLSEADQKIRYRQFRLPPAKPSGKKLAGDPPTQIQELVRLLHEEAKVI